MSHPKPQKRIVVATTIRGNTVCTYKSQFRYDKYNGRLSQVLISLQFISETLQTTPTPNPPPDTNPNEACYNEGKSLCATLCLGSIGLCIDPSWEAYTDTPTRGKQFSCISSVPGIGLNDLCQQAANSWPLTESSGSYQLCVC
mgnify:CR=1 FL=1